jgi:23S rRNA (pseudouridine1915-N3)-methyltransferase
MKFHLITVGKPKHEYAISGWHEYISRLQHFHTVRITHLADKHNDSSHFQAAIGNAASVALVIGGEQLSSPELADFIERRGLEGREIAWLIGGPDGLPAEIISNATYSLSFSKLTFPHDLAMVILAEALYRSSSINAGQPYHH